MKHPFPIRTAATAATVLALTAFPAAGMAASLLTDKAFDLTVGVGASYNPATDTLTGGSVSAAFGAATLETLKNQITDAGLTKINGAYSSTSAAVVRAGYRGLPMVLSTGANSSAVTLDIQSIGLNKTFSAKSSRDDNTKDMFEYLKSSGDSILNEMQKKLAEVSPVDPIAGNPASMQSRLVSDDFERGFTQFATNIKADAGEEQSSQNLISAGVTLGSMRAGGLSTDTTTIPLSYTLRNDLDPRKQFTVYAPISVSDTAGSKSGGVNLGVAYRFPVNDDWALMPSASYGVSGSVDLGAVAAMTSVSLTSQYTIRMDGYDLMVGNMVGAYQTSKVSAGDYSIDPKIQNTVFRNGLLASFPTSSFGRKMAFEVSVIVTNYTGSALYSSRYQELGLALGTNKSANSARSYFRAGVNFISGDNGVSGAKLNLGYWF